MDQDQVTNLLCEANHALGDKVIADMLPAPFKIRVSDHDTGRQIYITAAAPGLVPIEVWLGSVWRFSRYEFNDVNRKLGFQDAAEWAVKPLTDFFDAVTNALAADRSDRAQQGMAYRQKVAEQRERAAKIYAAMVGSVS